MNIKQKTGITIPHVQEKMNLLVERRNKILRELKNHGSVTKNRELILKQLWETYYPDSSEICQDVLNKLGELTLAEKYDTDTLDRHKNKAWLIFGEIIGEQF